MITVADVGEHALIARLRARVPAAPPDIPIAIGDDAAVLEPVRGELDVVTTDALVEDVHFRRAWCAPADIGHKALAVNLSDLAAMGATPRAALLSLALPDAFPLEDFDALVDGFLGLGRETRTALIGGNIARSPGPLVVDVTAIGSVRRRRVLTRSGGRPGHEIYVSGEIGLAAAGLAALDAAGPDGPFEAPAADGVLRYRRPTPRLRLGAVVGRARAASACMDLSDGLADAARQVAEASGTGIVIDALALPIHAAASALASSLGTAPDQVALSAGEDYELLFAVPPRRRRAFLAAVTRAGRLPVTKVGVLTREAGAWIERPGGRVSLGQGFEHFARK